MKVHFCGVGKMGLPMAGHLAHAGHAVSVSDPSSVQCQTAAALGLAVVDDAALDEALQQADVVMSSLPDDKALVILGARLAGAARPGSIYVDTSTVSPVVSAEVALALQARGVAYVRCTVSGNNKMAEAAQLTVMASGPKEAYEKVLPLLRVLGPTRFYLGEAEQARLMKLVVNLMIAQTSAMLGEALALGRKGGLDWQDMWHVLTASAVGSPILKAKSAQLSQRDFSPTFTVLQMIKDLELILGAGLTSQTPLPQTAMTLELMRSAVAAGLAQEDYAAILKVTERAAGLNDEGPNAGA